MTLKVSTIIPTFRRPLELEETVRSVLAQEGPVEVVVVDDSPEGAAQAVIEKFEDSRVRWFKMAKPTGGVPGLVRNFGLTQADGELVHFLDDDDVVPRGHYARARRFFEEHPKVGALFGKVAPFGVDDKALAHEHEFFSDAARRASRCNQLGAQAFAAVQAFQQTMLVCSAGMSRRTAVDAAGAFDPDVRMVEDVDYYARVFQKFPAAFLDEVTIHYRIGPSLMHSRLNDEKIVVSYNHMHARYRRELGQARYLALKVYAKSLLRFL
ncbi:MAG: glycosyltransferase [Myxococcaceae bacterium]|nr:glycosyltransferase [Myxococcaceae bacterium]